MQNFVSHRFQKSGDWDTVVVEVTADTDYSAALPQPATFQADPFTVRGVARQFCGSFTIEDR